MISKNAIYLLFSILTACTMEGGKDISNQSTANRQISQTKTDPHVPSCVRSEGGYETSTYCITVFNDLLPKEDFKAPTVRIYIKNKETNEIVTIHGEEWLDKDYNMYGFKGRSKDKIYEIDWREEKTHFRIWDASHKKLLEDELVIVGPEDILKDKSINP